MKSIWHQLNHCLLYIIHQLPFFVVIYFMLFAWFPYISAIFVVKKTFLLYIIRERVVFVSKLACCFVLLKLQSNVFTTQLVFILIPVFSSSMLFLFKKVLLNALLSMFIHLWFPDLHFDNRKTATKKSILCLLCALSPIFKHCFPNFFLNSSEFHWNISVDLYLLSYFLFLVSFSHYLLTISQYFDFFCFSSYQIVKFSTDHLITRR